MKNVEIFSADTCPYCRQAIDALDKLGISYSVRKIQMLAGRKTENDTFKEMKKRSNGQTTVPQIFVDGAHYGDEDTLFADIEKKRVKEIFG